MSSQSVYNAARNLNLLETLFGRKKTRKRKLTEDYIENYLIEHPEIKTRAQFQKKNASMYTTASKLKLLDKFFGIKKPKWTEETIINYLLEYPEIKSKSDFAKINPSAYQKTLKLNIIDDLFKKK